MGFFCSLSCLSNPLNELTKNHPSPQTNVFTSGAGGIKDDALAGGDRPLGAMKVNGGVALFSNRAESALLISLPIAYLGEKGGLRRGRGAVNPFKASGQESGTVEFGVLPPLHINGVVVGVFGDHKPWFPGAAQSESLALSEGVEIDPSVAADHLAVESFEGTWTVGDVPGDKILEVSLADKTDAGAVFFESGGEIVLMGQAAHLRFFQVTDGEENIFEYRFLEGVEKIGLILVGIHSRRQVVATVVELVLAVVPGGQKIGTDIHALLEKMLEFDLLIAEDIGIGCLPPVERVEKGTEDLFPILVDKLHRVAGDAQLVADIDHILVVPGGKAFTVGVLFVPIFHKQPHHPGPPLLEQDRRHGGVHPSAHAEGDGFSRKIPVLMGDHSGCFLSFLYCISQGCSPLCCGWF